MIEMLNDWRKYLTSGALLMLVAFCCYFYFAFQHMENALIQEKTAGRRMLIDLMCDTTDKFISPEAYKIFLAQNVGIIDAATGTYAELFDNKLNSLSVRTPTFERQVKIEEYPEAYSMMQTQHCGETVVPFARDDQSKPHELFLYWRWLPSDPDLDNKYLVVLGTSKYSLDVGYSRWIVYGAAGLIVVASVFIIGAIILLCSLGRIYQSRDGEKWRRGTYS